MTLVAQLLLIFLLFLGLVQSARKHGKEVCETENFWQSLISISLSATALWLAGAFSHIHLSFGP